MSSLDLTGKVALVTGASRGIGRATAAKLAAHGATVALAYGHNEAAARAALIGCGPGDHGLFAADLADPAAVEQLARAVLERYGRVDILVHNAAVFEPTPFDGERLDAWRSGWARVMQVNLQSAADLTFLLLPAMRAAGGGRVIHVASRAGHRGETEAIAYGASKAALINLAKSLARRFGSEGIISSAIAPGWVETDMASADLASAGDAIRAEIPQGRLATPDEIADAVLFLASPMGAYLNGATLDMNGASYVR